MRRIHRPYTLPAALLGAALLPLLYSHNALSKPPVSPTPPPPPHPIPVSPQSVILVGVATTKAMFHQCSRGTPQGVDGYWTPAIAQAQQLERDLPKTFPLLHTKGESFKTAGYFYQYVGFTRKGRRFVYVNAFSTRAAQEMKATWKTRPVDACDGGNMFWGVEYDVQKRTFSHLATNGYA